MMDKHRKVLIVGTVPYNEKSTSRAFDSYFHDWESDRLAQVFSNAKVPAKGHCGTLLQITDARLVKRRFDKKTKTAVVFSRDELPDVWENSDLDVSENVAKMYRFGSHKNSFVYLLRKMIWRKRYWCTDELNEWLDTFRPECVFLSFSDDFFILEIALYVAQRYDIPIVSSIGDDYYFNYRFSISPFYHVYKLWYRSLVRTVLRHRGSTIYIGNKIRDRYNSTFHLDGKTVYLTSTIQRKPYRPICVDNPKVCYFGNIRLGRNESLNAIARALSTIDPRYQVHVYSDENDPRVYGVFLDNSNVVYHGSVTYAEVQQKTTQSDIVLVVEGFKKKDVDISRYSLSTKVADSLASGTAVFAYGSAECGAIEYAGQTGCIQTCICQDDLVGLLRELIFDENLQKKNYERAADVIQKNHRLENSVRVFESVVNGVCGGKTEC